MAHKLDAEARKAIPARLPGWPRAGWVIPGGGLAPHYDNEAWGDPGISRGSGC